MKTKDVIRAWKDAGYRHNLSEADRAILPAHPSGMIELTDADLGVVSGGCGTTAQNCSAQCSGNCTEVIHCTHHCPTNISVLICVACPA